MTRDSVPSSENERLPSQEEQKKKFKEIKEELILHSAKAIISDATTSGFRFFSALLSLGVFLIPAYAALIKLSLGDDIRQTWIIASIPIALWLIGISLCLYLISPRMGWADMQNPIGIIENNREILSQKLTLSKLVSATLFLGVALAAYVLITPTAELIHLDSLVRNYGKELP